MLLLPDTCGRHGWCAATGRQMLKRRERDAQRRASEAEADVESLRQRNDELCQLLLERSARLEEALANVNAAGTHKVASDSRVEILHSRVKELQNANDMLMEQARQVCV